MTQIAVYGKGGIGKSTVSANLSAALARRGKRVLQIGCDPKHDSTRLLLGGRAIPTVLDYLRETLPDRRELDSLVFEGYGGVACVEAGGPEPGVGCAGRGILTTFEILEELGLRDIPFDIVLYDVLGDVVCGGFAVPLRKEYADAVFLVTSGEYMALYAANNILKGIRNFGDTAPGVAGIIHNSRGLDHEDHRVGIFADAVGLPIVASLPRSEYFAIAEKEGCTLAELYPDSEPAHIFSLLADYVEKLSAGPVAPFPASPLNDRKLEELVLGRKNPPTRSPVSRPGAGMKRPWDRPGKKQGFYTKSIRNKQPLQGCSFAGAVTVTSQVRDALTIAHGPRSCSHIASHFLDRTLLNAATRYGSPVSGVPESPILPTDMGDTEFIFGGERELISAIEAAAVSGWETVFIVTACPAGLIGDDPGRVISQIKGRHPGLRIIPVPVDGNLAGDFAQGLVEGCRKVLALADPSVEKECGTVNIVGEKTLSDNLESNYEIIRSLLEGIGLSVNCRFIVDTTSESIAGFKKAELNLPAYADESGTVLKALLEAEQGVEFFSLPFPVGFRESARWLEALAAISGKEQDAAAIIGEEKAFYEAEIAKLRIFLEGKRVLLSAFTPNLDWILDTIFDTGMEVVKTGLAFSPETADFNTRYTGRFPVEYDYTAEKRLEDIKELTPDLVLSNYPPVIPLYDVHHDAIPFSPDVGFRTGLIMAHRWSRFLRLPVVEGWKYGEAGP
jgi:nitrogenase iron protein